MAEGLTGPGDFILDECRIITHNNVNLDISNTVVGITLFEGIDSVSVSGSITISDTLNITSTGPIVGHEYLYLKIRTPSLSHEGNSTIDFSKNAFIINNISGRQTVSNSQIVVIHFVSLELIRNQRLRVQKSFTSSWSTIVQFMLGTDYLNSKKKVMIEETQGVKKFVAPSLRPLKVIDIAAKQAISRHKQEPTFLFYETLKGLNFRTVASLYNQKPLLSYKESPPGHNATGTKGYDLVEDLQNIISYQIVSSNEMLLNYRAGMLGSKLITHDIINKTYQDTNYNYHDNFYNEPHIVGAGTEKNEEHPYISESHVTRGHRMSDFPSRFFVYPITSSGGIDGQHTTKKNTTPFIAQDPHRWLQRRTSQIVQIENAFQVNVVVHGNTIISAGDIVKVNLPQRMTSIKTSESVDKIYQGPFLVKKIRHDFNFANSPRKHQMSMNLVKDSLEDSLEFTQDNPEPSATDGIVENYDF